MANENFDGGTPPLTPFSMDPQVDLKKSGLPWPVYLAIGLAVVIGGGFAALHSYQVRQKRKVHAGFMEQFADFEKSEVYGFWRCLFGKDGEALLRRDAPAWNAALEGALMADPKEFPAKVQNDCVPKAIKAAKAAKDFSPLPPTEYDAALESYSKALSGLANTINTWAESAPKRVETRLQEQKVKTSGDSWSGTGNPKKPDPAALQYDRFLRCAVPDLDKLKDGQALLEFIAGKCVGKRTDPEYLAKLRDTCIPQAQEAPAKAPPMFAKDLAKLAGDYDRETQAWDACFRAMRKLAKKDDLDAFDKTVAESINASSEVKKIGKENLKDE